MRSFIIFLILWMSLLVAGCQANAVDGGVPFEITPSPVIEAASTSLPVVSTPGEPQLTPSLPISTDAGLQSLIDKAVADLANRLSISTNGIKVLDATPVVWSDASLGCPQPGMAYAQVPEDGLLIRLQAASQIYEYHSGGVRDPFLCEKRVKDPNPPPQIDFFNITPNPKPTNDPAPPPDNGIPPGENQ